MINGVADGAARTGPDGSKLSAATIALWKAIQPTYSSNLACTDPNLKLVTPWWDPDTAIRARYSKGTPYKVSQGVLDHCGDNLVKCIPPQEDKDDPFVDAVNTDIMLEPAYIIAHTVGRIQ